MIAQIVALSPLLIVSAGIVFGLLLIATSRSQKIIQWFCVATLFLAFCSSLTQLSHPSIAVTPLVFVDAFSNFAQGLIYIVCAFVTGLSYQYLRNQVEVHDEFYILILLSALGAGVLVSANHFASLFLGFEILSLSLVGLVGYFREAKLAVEASIKYLILSAVASSFMLLGIAFIYGHSGVLTFTSSLTGGGMDSAFYTSGIFLFLLGVGFKLALVPFHLWVADVYQGASTLVTMIMATVSKVAMMAALYRVSTGMEVFQYPIVQSVFVFMAISSMLIGNLLALKQTNIKRLLAYSSIAHMGYLFVVLVVSDDSILSTLSAHALLFYLVTYVLATISAFYVVLRLNLHQLNEDMLDTQLLTGLFWTNRKLALLMLVALLGLAGIPLTAGFIGKFYLFNYLVLIKHWWLVAGLIMGSGIGLYYYLNIAISLFSQPKMEEAANLGRANSIETWLNGVAICALIILTLLVGIFPNSLLQFMSTL